MDQGQIRTTPGLEFNAQKHEYTFNGEKVPGVSEILKTIGLAKDWSSIDSFYAERGKMVHECIRLALKGTLAEDSIDEILQPYFEGFKRYWSERATQVYAVEVPLYSASCGGFAGTPDLITQDEIIDWKCSKNHDKVADLQGQAYKILAGGKRKFTVIQLPGDGSFCAYKYGTATRQWLSVMDLYAWKTHRKRKRAHVGHHRGL